MKSTGPNSLGQHTLTDEVTLQQIIHEANLAKTEKVLEIGAGEGNLTSYLCMNSGQVTSIEIDKAKFERAKKRLAHFDNLLLLNINPFDHGPTRFEFDIFVSNIPYSRSKETILWLTDHKFSRAILMVQREFARKLLSTPGKRSYRAISVICKYCFNTKVLFEVPCSSFSPPPTVSSQVIKLSPTGQELSDATKKNIMLLFSQKNRTIHKATSYLGLNSGIDSRQRICQLNANEIVEIAVSMTRSR
jgi:16S rRNA (adenine1518-N6/adenine1519-N6)-dimethyltransferase